jgi:hypothetical protein
MNGLTAERMEKRQGVLGTTKGEKFVLLLAAPIVFACQRTARGQVAINPFPSLSPCFPR